MTTVPTIHVWRAKDQPATRYVIEFNMADGTTQRHTMCFRRRKLVFTKCCEKRRRAGNCIVHVYYDEIYCFCRKGKGCK